MNKLINIFKKAVLLLVLPLVMVGAALVGMVVLTIIYLESIVFNSSKDAYSSETELDLY